MKNELFKNWGLLISLQALLAFLIFREFIVGTLYFAYLDIAADTYALFTSHAIMFARLFSREGWPSWSFDIGLGAPLGYLMTDTFVLLTQLAGPEHVLSLRIWVYLLKIALGGAFFLLLVRPWVRQREAAIIAALAYSFCGYMISNGEWDGEANAYVMYPMMLWGIAHYMRTGNQFVVPLTVAAALYSGLFFLSIGVSLVLACAAFCAMSEAPKATLKTWVTRIAPMVVVGYLLASPYVLPAAFQYLDSPRVSGPGALMSKLVNEGFGITDLRILVAQLGGFLHKDVFGSGDNYAGYMNYAEGPGFYVGTLALIVIAQLWGGSATDRRVLVVGVVAIVLYVVFPFFRLSAFGFAAPYFRSTAVWVTLALSLMSLRALDRVLVEGVNLRLLAVGCALVAALLGALLLQTLIPVSRSYAMRIAVLAAAGAAALALSHTRIIPAGRLAQVLLALGAIEIVLVAWPSYHVGRAIVSPKVQPFNDITPAALKAIRERDASVFRIEKTYTSVHTSDAMAQGYMGVRSYYYHGADIVKFHAGMDLMIDYGGWLPINYTNWLPDPGQRYMLHSVLGVKYLIAKKPVQLPGFESFAAGPGFEVYKNQLALPLGVVHNRQVTRADMARLSSHSLEKSRRIKDAVLMNAVVVDEFMPDRGKPFDIKSLESAAQPDHDAYAAQARMLQQTGLRITRFSNHRIEGTIHPTEAGLLVFSIPFYKGWSLRIDGKPVDVQRVNFGMLGAPVAAGPHSVELTYSLPGRMTGLGLGALGVLLLALWVGFGRRPR